MSLKHADLNDFAERYTAAWCSQKPTRVASFFAPDGSLTINNGSPAIGREAIAEAAQSFMTAFPDLCVKMDELVESSDGVEYHWTLTGTHSGPGGTGNAVRISGFERWQFGEGGLIAVSMGEFDSGEYERQLAPGSSKRE